MGNGKGWGVVASEDKADALFSLFALMGFDFFFVGNYDSRATCAAREITTMLW